MISHSSLKLMIDVAPCGVLLVDEKVQVKAYNKAILNILPWVEESFIEKSPGLSLKCYNIKKFDSECGKTPNCSICIVRNLITKALNLEEESEAVEFEFESLIDGVININWLKLKVVPLKIENLRHALCVLENINDHKRIVFELEKTREAAERANKLKSEFLANMSHEIRTPLNGIKGMIDITLMTELSESQKENLVIAKNCSEGLLTVINELLDFSKIEAGKLMFDEVTFDLHEIVERTVRIHSKIAKEKGIKLETEINKNAPRYLNGDPTRIKQILDNLVNNAIKFTDDGVVKINISLMHWTATHSTMKFEVSDTGIGIAKEDQRKLFTSFEQIDSSYTRKYGGTGLGLAISKALIEKMGGKICVESDAGKGSKFTVELELTNVENAVDNSLKVDRYEKFSKDLKVLIVEDDQINLMVMTNVMKVFGLSAIIANDGAEAVNLVKETDFDVILMDIQMPVMDGIEATKHIREIQKDKNFSSRIIAVTAYAMMGDRENFLDKQIDGYISKPIDLSQLYRVFEEAIRDKENQSDGVEKCMESNFVEINERKIDCDKQLSEGNKRLEEAVGMRNLQMIEKEVHLLKEIFEMQNNNDLKILAFKIELAARRDDYETIEQQYAKLIEELKKNGTKE